MARLSLRERFRRPETEPAGDAPPAAPRRALPPPGTLRRERRSLVRAREERIRDLGGLMLEMFRRDRFREDLLAQQCQDVIAIEERLSEVDAQLATAIDARRSRTAPRCECGAPIIWGSHFCANCGRPTGATPVVSCSNCGAPLPADVRFCASCGAQSEIAAAKQEAYEESAGEVGEPVAVPEQAKAKAPAGRQRKKSAEQPPDPWES